MSTPEERKEALREKIEKIKKEKEQETINERLNDKTLDWKKDILSLHTDDYQNRGGNYPKDGIPVSIDVFDSDDEIVSITASFKNTSETEAREYIERKFLPKLDTSLNTKVSTSQDGDYHDDWVNVYIEVENENLQLNNQEEEISLDSFLDDAEEEAKQPTLEDLQKVSEDLQKLNGAHARSHLEDMATKEIRETSHEEAVQVELDKSERKTFREGIDKQEPIKEDKPKLKDDLDTFIERLIAKMENESEPDEANEMLGQYYAAVSSLNNYSGKNISFLLNQVEERNMENAIFGSDDDNKGIIINQVKSYKQWQEKGIQVKKGEQSLKIYAPFVQYKIKKDSNGNPIKKGGYWDYEKDENGKKIKAGTKFLQVPVFNSDQTNGEEIGLITKINLVNENNEISEQLLNNFINEISTKYNIPIQQKVLSPNLGGFYMPGNHTITLNENRDNKEKLKVLFHELGHSMLHNKEMIKSSEEISTGIKEAEAESVSFILSSKLGIDGGSDFYIKSYGNDVKTIKDRLERITEASKDVFNKIDFDVLIKDEQDRLLEEKYTLDNDVQNEIVEKLENELQELQEKVNEPDEDLVEEIRQLKETIKELEEREFESLTSSQPVEQSEDVQEIDEEISKLNVRNKIELEPMFVFNDGPEAEAAYNEYNDNIEKILVLQEKRSRVRESEGTKSITPEQQQKIDEHKELVQEIDELKLELEKKEKLNTELTDYAKKAKSMNDDLSSRLNGKSKKKTNTNTNTNTTSMSPEPQ